MGMKRFTSKMLFLRAADAATCGRNAKKAWETRLFWSPPLFWKGERPHRRPWALGRFRRPFGAPSGATGPLFTAEQGPDGPASQSLLGPGGRGIPGGAGGRRHLAAGAKGPGLPNGKPGPGGQRPPGPGFQGAARPRRPPGPQRSRRLKGGRGVERGIAKTGARIKCPCDRAGRNI